MRPLNGFDIKEKGGLAGGRGREEGGWDIMVKVGIEIIINLLVDKNGQNGVGGVFADEPAFQKQPVPLLLREVHQEIVDSQRAQQGPGEVLRYDIV